MIGIATGLAKEGLIPFVYSIANFASLRPYEFIRNGPIHHQLPVRIIGVGSGFDYGPAGVTHYNLEDIGVFRVQQGISLMIPADKNQIRDMLNKTYALPQPVYYRIGKSIGKSLGALENKFELDQLIALSKGNDIVFITTGTIAPEVLKACELLSDQGIFASVYLLSTFNPSVAHSLKSVLSQFAVCLTVEEHYINGGLGSYVCEVVAEHNINTRIVRCGVDAKTLNVTGSKDFMNKLFGLTAELLAGKAIDTLKTFKNEKSSILHNSSYPQTV
jgi:transketolase